MADYTDAKRTQGSVFPQDAYDAGGSPVRVEPLLDAEYFVSRFLFGIPLVSPFDPTSKITPEMLRDYINRGIGKFELDTKTTVSPVLRRVRLPFDPNLYYNNIWCEVPWKPVQKVLKLAIVSASYQDGPSKDDRYPLGNQIYAIPTQWVDLSYANHGKIFVNPINPAFAAVGFTTQAASSGATILQFIGVQGWVPAYWSIECEVGLCSQEGNVPVFVNEAVGQAAAILILDNLIPLFRSSSQSLGIDGLSQSSSDEMNRLLSEKRRQLAQDYKESINLIKTHYGIKFFASNV